MKTFKVLRVISTMNPMKGGPCQGIRNSIPALEKMGISNEVVSLDEPSASFIAKENFKIYAIGPYKGPWQYSDQLVPWLIKNINNYDAVIVHGLWLYHGYAVNKVFKYYKKKGEGKVPKLFVMPHGMLDPYFQKASGRKIKALRNLLYWKLIESKLVNHSNGLLFTTQEELLLARMPFTPYHPQKELNVGYGIVDPPKYTDKMKLAFLAVCPKVTDNSFFLFLSRIHEKKGVDLLIKAYASLFKNNYSYLPKLIIAGPGIDTHYGLEMKTLVENDLNLKSSVYFAGMLSGDAKWGAFYCCEAFILPSHQENFGIAVVEALACSRPALISNQVNIWREITGGKAGLVELDTLYGTQKIFEEWLSLTEADKKIMGKHARDTFEEKFNIANTVQKLADVLTSNSSLIN